VAYALKICIEIKAKNIFVTIAMHVYFQLNEVYINVKKHNF